MCLLKTIRQNMVEEGVKQLLVMDLPVPINTALIIPTYWQWPDDRMLIDRGPFAVVDLGWDDKKHNTNTLCMWPARWKSLKGHAACVINLYCASQEPRRSAVDGRWFYPPAAVRPPEMDDISPVAVTHLPCVMRHR